MCRLVAFAIGSLVSLLVTGTNGQAFINDQAIQDAIQRGIAYLKGTQQRDGTWPSSHNPGLTALVGLALLESGCLPTDAPVQRAAAAVRRDCLKIGQNYHTYCAATVILFLDRLGNAADEALIDGLVYWILTGQTVKGTWGYSCGSLPAEEGRLIKQYLDLQSQAAADQEPAKKRNERMERLGEDLQQRFKQLARQQRKPHRVEFPDHSNTQFAVLALWAGRRHGMPVDDALRKAETQIFADQNPDGSWSYVTAKPALHTDYLPADTCNGLLVIALGQAVAGRGMDEAANTGNDVRTRGNSQRPGNAVKGGLDKSSQDEAKTQRRRLGHIQAGLIALARFIAVEIQSRRGRPPAISAVGTAFVFRGRNFYCFLWSLDKMCAAFDLQSIGEIDWYRWGAEIALLNQGSNGSWFGGETQYTSLADTSFALLFLGRSNLTIACCAANATFVFRQPTAIQFFPQTKPVDSDVVSNTSIRQLCVRPVDQCRPLPDWPGDHTWSNSIPVHLD